MIKKRISLSFILGLMLIKSVSAQYFGTFSLSNFLYSIEPSTMILLAIFILSFLFVNWSLLKFFRENKIFAGVGAFVVASLITYGINRTGFDFAGIFYSIGLSSDFLSIMLPFLLLGGLISLSYSRKEKRFSWSRFFIIPGVLLIILSFTNFVYEKGVAFVIGIIFVVIGWFLRKKQPPASV